MKLLIEKFVLNPISDIQRQLLDSGSNSEKIKASLVVEYADGKSERNRHSGGHSQRGRLHQVRLLPV